MDKTSYTENPNASMIPAAEGIFESICRMQYDTNTKMAGSDWLTKPLEFNYRAAEYEEKLELLTSAGWQPFWKSGPAPQTDLENCHMELVDILHFRISSHFQEVYSAYLSDGKLEGKTEEEIKMLLIAEVTDIYLPPTYMDSVGLNEQNRHWDYKISQLRLTYPSYFQSGHPPSPQEYVEVATMVECGSFSADDLMFVANYFGLDQTTFALMYVAKNALNHFRTNNGYKEGKYQKIWLDSKEDNYYIMQYVRNATAENTNLTWGFLYRTIGKLYTFYTGHESK